MDYILCSMFRWCRRLWYSCCSLMFGLSHNFQQYLNYILWVSFISGGNRSALWKSPTFFKSLTKSMALCYMYMKYILSCAGIKLTKLV